MKRASLLRKSHQFEHYFNSWLCNEGLFGNLLLTLAIFKCYRASFCGLHLHACNMLETCFDEENQPLTSFA